MKVDDYGCQRGEPKFLRPLLFPLQLDQVREADVQRWIAECEKSGLVRFYEVAGKQYIQVLNFKQRTRAPSKFPLPPNDGQTTGTRPSHDGHLLAYSEAHAHSDSHAHSDGQARPDPEHPPPPEAADVPPDLDAQIRTFIGTSPLMPVWNRGEHDAMRKLVNAVGWSRAREMIAEVRKDPTVVSPSKVALARVADEQARGAEETPESVASKGMEIIRLRRKEKAGK